MRVVLWLLRIAVFIFLLAFALKNTEPVSVRFFFESIWQAPLIIIVLAFFAAGVALGALLLLGTLFGLRREVARLKRVLKDRDNQAQAALAGDTLPMAETGVTAPSGVAENK